MHILSHSPAPAYKKAGASSYSCKHQPVIPFQTTMTGYFKEEVKYTGC